MAYMGIRLALLTGFALSLLVGYVGAAESSKPWRIGYITPGSLEDDARYFEEFRAGLKAFGYTDGTNVVIDRRVTSGIEGLTANAADLVDRKVDLIVAVTTPAARAAKAATSSIPIVFVGPSDPVGSGLVTTLARPGANVTGMTDQGVDLSAKRLELLKQTVPRMKRVVVLGHPADPVWKPVWAEVQLAASALGIEVTPALMHTPGQLGELFGSFDKTAQALYVAPQAVFWVNRHEIIKLAARARLPAIYEVPDFVRSGGLVSYGTDYLSMYWDAARYVDKIFRGARPADLPVEQPRKYAVAINLNTAKALGLTVPESLVLLADEVIR